MAWCPTCNSEVIASPYGFCPQGHRATEDVPATYVRPSDDPPREPGESIKGIGAALLAVVVLLGGIGYFLLGLPRDEADAALLRRSFSSGETRRYSIQMLGSGTFSFLGKSEKYRETLRMRATERVASVEEDGTARLRYTFDRISRVEDGKRRRVPRRALLDLRVAPDGIVRSSRWRGPASERDALGFSSKQTHFDMLWPAFPERAVRVGEQWSNVITTESPFSEDEEISLHLENRLERVSRVDDRIASVVVRTTTSVPFQERVPLRAFLRSVGEDTAGVPEGVILSFRAVVRVRLWQTVNVATGHVTYATGGATMSLSATFGYQGYSVPLRGRLRFTLRMVELPATA